ncbi:MAG: reverse transcriptase family protein, partial [Candidatus Thiodiazotropha sp.]
DILQYEVQPFDVFIFTETWLNDAVNPNDIKIINYKDPFRCDRNTRSGGVAIYVKETLNCVRRTDLEIKDLECVWLQLSSHSRNILICGIYRPPNSPSSYWNLLHESFDRAKNTNFQDIFILGDLNNDMLNATKSRNLQDLITTFNFTQLIAEPTHYTENSSSLIDVILANNVNNVLMSEVCDPFIPNLTRYHCPVAVLLKFIKPKQKPFKRKIWKYDQGDYLLYRQTLFETDWDPVLSGETDTVADAITSTIFQAASDAIPNKVATIRPTDPPWMHNEIRILIRQRKRIHKKAKKTNNVQLWSKYRKIRNKVVKVIRSSKINYEKRVAELLKNKSTNIKTWWKLSKQLLNLDKTVETLPSLCYNNVTYEDDTEKAEIFNTFFISKCQLNDALAILPEIEYPPYQPLEIINISPEDVRDVLKNLNTSKASGPDLINPRLLKEGSEELCTPLSIFFNHLLNVGKFPQMWKDGNVTPIHKKGDRHIPDNFRPISLLSGIGKVMERCIHKYVYNYCITNNIFTPYQSGFIKGDSTTYQLLDLYNSFCEAVDSGKEVRVIFCDISKAFDRVWHAGLIHKLKCIGITGKLIDWFLDYLSNRRQRVVLNGKASSFLNVPAGVPQGSILGPLLFLIYINDIVVELSCNVRLFADDTSLYVIVENPVTAGNILNRNLDSIHSWATAWLVDFNPAKTESMVISKKRIKPNHPQLYMDNTEITEVSDHRHLGLVFSSDCGWHNHIVTVTGKAWQRISVLRSFKFRLDRNSLERMYVSFIRPVLEYSGSVWDNCTLNDNKSLEAVNIEAMRIITGATKLCSIAKLYDETGWATLETRRNAQKLIIFYKMINGLTPAYLSQLIPPLVHESSQYSLRNSNNISTVHAHSNMYYNSFLPSVIRAWNNLPVLVRNSISLADFKKNLNIQRSPPPAYYNFGDRISQIYHTRLRLECSSLKQHLFRKNLIENPTCSCGQVETVKHYLLDCNNYTQI